MIFYILRDSGFNIGINSEFYVIKFSKVYLLPIKYIVEYFKDVVISMAVAWA